MQTEQRQWTAAKGWTPGESASLEEASVVFVFGATEALQNPERLDALKRWYPRARIFGCSTAGEICGTQVSDDSIVATALRLGMTKVQGAQVRLRDSQDFKEVGRQLARQLAGPGLGHVFVLSEGLKINGTALVEGLRAHLPPSVAVTGGLSGDGARFQKTLVLLDGPPEPNLVAALGFYGSNLKVGYGSLGGWDPFGPERMITRSEGSVLYELDGQSALSLYKTYLGDYAGGLPATGLLFPLSLRNGREETGIVRTILGVDEQRQSLTFAGDVPQGFFARLMKANFERLIDGATGAARASCESLGVPNPDVALLISCVGRKLVLKQRVEEEVEGVREIVGPRTVMTGFYSYGEICPFVPLGRCELHNQTMTITTFSER